MVSVEAAIATGSLVAVLALILATMSALLLQLRCADAAGEAARLASRGDVGAARRAAARLVPDSAGIVVETHGEEVTVRVVAAPLGSMLPGLRVSAGATAAREPDTVAPAAPGDDTAAGGDTAAGDDTAAGSGSAAGGAGPGGVDASAPAGRPP